MAKDQALGTLQRLRTVVGRRAGKAEPGSTSDLLWAVEASISLVISKYLKVDDDMLKAARENIDEWVQSAIDKRGQ